MDNFKHIRNLLINIESTEQYFKAIKVQFSKQELGEIARVLRKDAIMFEQQIKRNYQLKK